MTDNAAPIDHAAEAKRLVAEDALASIAHSLIELTEALKMGAIPQNLVIGNCDPIAIDLVDVHGPRRRVGIMERQD